MVDYSFYIGNYHGGSITAEEWPIAEREASATLARYKRIYTVKAPAEDAESMAVCAIAESMVYHAKAEQENVISSVSVGSVSTSFKTVQADHSEKRKSMDAYKAACLYLDIYRGVGSC